MKFKTFLINMKKSPERLVFMTNQLQTLGMPFEIQEGIDGRTYDFSVIYDEAMSLRLNGSPLAAVEKGCALSHKSVLEQAFREQLDYVLILEDDVELPSNFKQILDEELHKREFKETNLEYLSFNYPTVGLKFIKLWLFLLQEQFKKRPTTALYFRIPLYGIKFVGIVIFSIVEGSRDMIYKKIFLHGKPARFYRPMYLAGCYLVTREGIEKLLSVQEKLIYPADRIQNVARIRKGLKLFHYVPLVVKQRRDKFESTMYQNKDYIFSQYD
ncbi:MAG: glycosyltransferase family 25 protein [bacterium]